MSKKVILAQVAAVLEGVEAEDRHRAVGEVRGGRCEEKLSGTVSAPRHLEVADSHPNAFCG